MQRTALSLSSSSSSSSSSGSRCGHPTAAPSDYWVLGGLRVGDNSTAAGSPSKEILIANPTGTLATDDLVWSGPGVPFNSGWVDIMMIADTSTGKIIWFAQSKALTYFDPPRGPITKVILYADVPCAVETEFQTMWRNVVVEFYSAAGNLIPGSPGNLPPDCWPAAQPPSLQPQRDHQAEVVPPFGTAATKVVVTAEVTLEALVKMHRDKRPLVGTPSEDDIVDRVYVFAALRNSSSSSSSSSSAGGRLVRPAGHTGSQSPRQEPRP